MEPRVDFCLERYGFYPAGGGIATATIAPCARLAPITLLDRGARHSAYAEAFVAGIPASVGQRELACIGAKMGWEEAQLQLKALPGEQGPGNAVLLTLEYEHVTEVFTGFGAKMVRVETVAAQALKEARLYRLRCCSRRVSRRPADIADGAGWKWPLHRRRGKPACTDQCRGHHPLPAGENRVRAQ